MIEFEFSTTECYLLVFTDLNIKIYRVSDDLLIATVATTWPTASIRSLKFAQTSNLMVISNIDHPPRTLSRDLTDETIWNCTRSKK